MMVMVEHCGRGGDEIENERSIGGARPAGRRRRGRRLVSQRLCDSRARVGERARLLPLNLFVKRAQI
jgi:hypothetical protein